ncbi:hypothetical protein GCM10010381_43910 [Streptomyces xantholiticus]|nr:hypothetical protein GCM10010381_43910 [Streptomyces xantholiticus]
MTAYAAAGIDWTTAGYVFAARTGRPIEPPNVHRSFVRVGEAAGLRLVRLHDARHRLRNLTHGRRGRGPAS